MSAAYNKFFINGEWIEPEGRETLEVVNPANEKAFATISMGNRDDVDRAAKAAKSAFVSWSNSSIETRKEVISKIIGGLKSRGDEMASAISSEMGAPMGLAKTAQLGSGLGHFVNVLTMLEYVEVEDVRGPAIFIKEPGGGWGGGAAQGAAARRG